LEILDRFIKTVIALPILYDHKISMASGKIFVVALDELGSGYYADFVKIWEHVSFPSLSKSDGNRPKMAALKLLAAASP